MNPLVPSGARRLGRADRRGSYRSRLCTTAAAPQIPVLFDNASAVPYDLGDVVLFVSRDVGGSDSAVSVHGGSLHGAVRDHVDRLERDDRRSRATSRISRCGRMARSGRSPCNATDGTRNDAASGNFLQIDTGNATTTNTGDDGIETWQVNNATPPADERPRCGLRVPCA